MIRPSHIAGLHRQVEFVTDIGTCRAAVRGRSVARSGVGVGGVALSTIGTDSEHSCSTMSILRDCALDLTALVLSRFLWGR